MSYPGQYGIRPFGTEIDYDEINWTAPDAPTNLSLLEVDDTVEITFDISDGEWIEVYSSYESADNFNLVSRVAASEWTGSPKIVDESFNRKTTIYYRVYSVRVGIPSAALTGNVVLANDASDVTNLVVTDSVDHFIIEYDLPTENTFSHVTITRHADAVGGNLSEGSATQIYSGTNGHVYYSVLDADIGKYHQFWVTTVTRT